MRYAMKSRLAFGIISLFLSPFCLPLLSAPEVFARAKAVPESPENAITVENYEWATGGSGTAGIIREITLKNNGKLSYKNIEIEVDFFTANDIPLGSLRTAIRDELPGKSEKTFYNVSVGFMHSELQKTVFRVVGAEVVTIPGVTQSPPRDVLVVKGWEWTGGQYATEGILKQITIENKSKVNYRNIKLRLDHLSGGGTVISSGTAVIKDVLPAETEKAFYGVNVGFRDPNASKTQIGVLDASAVSDKVAKRRGRKPAKKLTTQEVERIGVKVSKRQIEVADSPQTPDENAEDSGRRITRRTREGTFSSSRRGGTANAAENVEEYVYEYEEEPVPDIDIIVIDFKLGGGNVTGIIGRLEELTLENTSSITYSNIELDVDFYSGTDERPLGSNRIMIDDVLPPYTEKTFRDVKLGYLNTILADVEISVVNARVVE